MSGNTEGPASMREPPGEVTPELVLREFQRYIRGSYESFGWDPATHWVFRVCEDVTGE